MVNNKINGGGYFDFSWLTKTPEVEKEPSNQEVLNEETAKEIGEKKPTTLMSYLPSFSFFNSNPASQQVNQTQGYIPGQVESKGGKRKTKKAKKSKKSKTSKSKK